MNLSKSYRTNLTLFFFQININYSLTIWVVNTYSYYIYFFLVISPNITNCERLRDVPLRYRKRPDKCYYYSVDVSTFIYFFCLTYQSWPNFVCFIFFLWHFRKKFNLCYFLFLLSHFLWRVQTMLSLIYIFHFAMELFFKNSLFFKYLRNNAYQLSSGEKQVLKIVLDTV